MKKILILYGSYGGGHLSAAKSIQKYFEDTLEKYTGFNENNFYFNDNGIVIYFQSYEIAPYASGSPEFNISYSFLRNYLKKDFIP